MQSFSARIGDVYREEAWHVLLEIMFGSGAVVVYGLS